MNDMVPVFVVAIVVVVAVVVGAAWYLSPSARIRRALRAAPARSISEVVEGALVRLDGTVAPGPTVIAPLSGRPCVFYEASVDEWVSNGKSGSWRNRVREVRGVAFVLDDGTGRAVIDPTGAHVDVELDRTSKSGTFDDPDPTEQAFLDRHGTAGAGWVFNKRLRYREGVIEIGEAIAAMGTALREPDPDGAARVTGYRDALPTRVRLGGDGDHPIRLSDARGLARARGVGA